MAKFKEGDRVRVIEANPADRVSVGETGVVVEEHSLPWVRMDDYSEKRRNCFAFNIPKGHAAVLGEQQLELIDERTTADDCRDYGIAFEVDGKRVDPRRVLVYWPAVVRRDD